MRKIDNSLNTFIDQIEERVNKGEEISYLGDQLITLVLIKMWQELRAIRELLEKKDD